MPSVPYVAINLIAERQVAGIATKGTRSTKARELQRAEKGREGPPGRLVTCMSAGALAEDEYLELGTSAPAACYFRASGVVVMPIRKSGLPAVG